jgi:RNA polymerase sigma-70 factor (ECF subfamily)
MDRDVLYREVTEKHGPALARFAAGYEASPERRSELLREMHASIWKSLALFDQRTPLRTWVCRVAHNVGTSHLVRHTALVRFGDLRPLDLQVRLLFSENIDALAIAEITGLSPSDVALRVHRLKPYATREEAPDLPRAFTISELHERGVDAGAGETNKFLERMLVERRTEQLFRLAGGVLLVPLLFLIRPAMESVRTILLLAVAIFGAGLVLAARQALLVGGTTRALAELRAPERQRRGWQPSIGFVLSLSTIAVVTGFVALVRFGDERVPQARREEAIASVDRCLDPRRTNDPKCGNVLGLQPPAVQAPIAQLPSEPNCEQRRRTLEEAAELETLEKTFVEAVTLGDACPQELLLPSRVLKKELLKELTETSRKGCFANDKAEALYRCELHARLECPGKPAAWRERNEAFLEFLSLRAGQTPQPWACVDSPVIGLLRALETSTPENVSLDSFEDKSGTSTISGTAGLRTEVAEFMHRLEYVVKTSKGLGRVVERDRDGQVRVELFGSDDAMELAPSEVTKLFPRVEATSVIRDLSSPPESQLTFKFVVTLNIDRSALPSGREYVVPYVPDVMVEHYAELVRADPENAEAWLSLAYARKAQNKPEEAIAAFRNYLELRPDASTRKELENQMYLLGGQ